MVCGERLVPFSVVFPYYFEESWNVEITVVVFKANCHDCHTLYKIPCVDDLMKLHFRYFIIWQFVSLLEFCIKLPNCTAKKININTFLICVFSLLFFLVFFLLLFVFCFYTKTKNYIENMHLRSYKCLLNHTKPVKTMWNGHFILF